jgi:hypothetical protein
MVEIVGAHCRDADCGQTEMGCRKHIDSIKASYIYHVVFDDIVVTHRTEAGVLVCKS